MPQQTRVDLKKAEQVLFRVVGDVGGAFAVAHAYLGDKFGLFKSLSTDGPLASAELAKKTVLVERYVREWLKCMVAAEYVEYDANADKYYMTEEQAFVLANEESPLFAGGGVQITTGSLLNLPKIAEVFKKGGGVPLTQLGSDVIEGTERFFAPGYKHFLLQDWLPRIPGLTQRLEQGGAILDVGCGCGQSTAQLAKGFPKTTVVGIDFDAVSVQRAKKLCDEHHLKNVQFLQVSAEQIPKNQKYDLACAFDCVHDMAQPVMTLTAIRESLKNDGVFIWAEPNASDAPLENRNLMGKVFTGISPFYCLTVSLAGQGRGTGNQLGERGAKTLAQEAGFSHFEKLPIEHPVNQFFLLKP